MIPRKNVAPFFEIINSIESSLKFTIEEESENSISFLDVKITKLENGSFSTTLYHKPTSTGRYLNFASNHPRCQMRGVVRTLMHRASSIPSTNGEKLKEIGYVTKALKTNGFPDNFIRSVTTPATGSKSDSEERRKRMSIPYISGISEKIARCLRQSKIDVSFKPVNKISTILPRPKDPVEQLEKCGVAYNIKCRECSLSYVGQTKNSLQTRLSQHKAALRHLQTDKSALAEHCVTEDHQIDWSNARVLAQESDWNKRLFLEAFFSQKMTPVLNRCEMFIPKVFTEFCE